MLFCPSAAVGAIWMLVRFGSSVIVVYESKRDGFFKFDFYCGEVFNAAESNM